MFHFREYAIDNAADELNIIPNSIILGKVLAQELLVEVGDIVYVATPSGQIFPLKLVGYYQSGFRDFDRIQAYTSLVTARKILGKPTNYVTDLQVKLHNVAEAPAVAREYKNLFNIQAVDIQAANTELESGRSIRNTIAYLVSITLLIVSGFGIYNILNMLIYEKMDTIAILKATGFSGKDVKRIFLIIALSIGVFGGIAGLILGYGCALLIHTVPFNFPSLPSIKTYPINNHPMFYVIGICFSLLTTYLAGIFPALKASKVDPIVILRGK